MKTRLLVIATIAGAALAVTGCSAVNPITTSQKYAASDGLQADLGSVTALNLLLVSEGDGEQAVLIGALYNHTADVVTVQISIDGSQIQSVDVPAFTTATLGTGESDEVVAGVASAAPGFIADVSMRTVDAGLVQTPVPVVDGTLPEYQMVLDGLPDAMARNVA